MRYYFSAEGYHRNGQYPVRVDINGTRTNLANGEKSTFYHMYSFMGFHEIRPDYAEFNVPRGVLCGGGNRTIPTVPHAFTVNMEVSILPDVERPERAPVNVTANYRVRRRACVRTCSLGARRSSPPSPRTCSRVRLVAPGGQDRVPTLTRAT